MAIFKKTEDGFEFDPDTDQVTGMTIFGIVAAICAAVMVGYVSTRPVPVCPAPPKVEVRCVMPALSAEATPASDAGVTP